MNAKPSDFPTEVMTVLEHWYGGQFTDAYRVLSSDGDVPPSVVEGAASELERALNAAKKKNYKGFRRADINELKAAIDILNYIADSRAKGREPV